MPTVLARNLHRRRRALGYSQISLSADSEVSQSWISRVEAGETPSIGVLTKLARALKTDVSSLFIDKDKGAVRDAH